jgi:hypothetical protein
MRKTRLAITKRVNAKILLLRGQKVIIDSDLAELYGVEVKHLNQQVKRNHRRFPQDFVFRLRPRELENSMSQIGTSSERHGGRRLRQRIDGESDLKRQITVLKRKVVGRWHSSRVPEGPHCIITRHAR